MKIILAPDSFKGSLTAREAAEAMAAGVRKVCPDAEIVLLPLADGGEGTADALVTATGGRLITSRVTGPLGSAVDAQWGLLGPNGETAVVEMAAAAGLTLVSPGERDPGRATTYGAGELIREAVRSGARHLLVGLGGSATNDGGAGAMQALGVKFFDAAGKLLPERLGGRDLLRLARIDVGEMLSFQDVMVTIASDVTNPLLGPNGASAVYGPQKGASAEDVAALEAASANYAAVIKRDLGMDVAHRPGAGAAGGMGAGLMAFLSAQMQSGIDLVLDAACFNAHLAGTDWVWTGEGRVDAQTLQGKTVAGVLRRCRAHQTPVIAFGGSVDGGTAAELASAGLAAAFPIVAGPTTLEEAMREGRTLLTQAAARVACLICRR